MFDKIKKIVQATHRKAANAIGTASGVEECCYRCKDKFNWKTPHFTVYSPGLACSPLCEDCWKTLQPLERLPFYYQFVEQTFGTGDYSAVKDVSLQQIRKSIFEGK